jgi:hypothetical protein
VQENDFCRDAVRGEPNRTHLIAALELALALLTTELAAGVTLPSVLLLLAAGLLAIALTAWSLLTLVLLFATLVFIQIVRHDCFLR